MFVFEDELVREFNPGDGRMRCATGVAAIVRMGPHWSTLALSIKSRREGGGTIWHFCPWAPPLLGVSLLRATNSNLSKYLVQRSLSKLAPF